MNREKRKKHLEAEHLDSQDEMLRESGLERVRKTNNDTTITRC